MNELSPVISFDVHLGHFVDDITIDYDKLVAYMQQRGFEDSEIADTPIYISSAVPIAEVDAAGKKEQAVTLGGYERLVDGIYLYPAYEIVQAASNAATRDASESVASGLVTARQQHTSRLFSKTLVHELEHKYLGKDEAMQRANKQYARHETQRLIGKAIGASIIGGSMMVAELEATRDMLPSGGVIALNVALFYTIARSLARQRNSYEKYRNAPEERQCREAEVSGPDDLIAIQFNRRLINALQKLVISVE